MPLNMIQQRLACLTLECRRRNVMPDIFMSYSCTDKEFVRKLHDALAKLNRDTWVDWEGIPLTAKWLKEIYAGIEADDNFVL